jgi:hypothetical protein
MKYLIAFLLLICTRGLMAAPIDTVLVLIDERSEQELGAYAQDRDALPP